MDSFTVVLSILPMSPYHEGGCFRRSLYIVSREWEACGVSGANLFSVQMNKEKTTNYTRDMNVYT